MSEKDMLGGTLTVQDARGPLNDFMGKLAGDQGPEWLSAFKRFLRKQEAWKAEEPKPRRSKRRKVRSSPDASLEVDLDQIDLIPSEWKNSSMKVETNHLMGKVRIERRGDELYVNDVKFDLYCSPKQLSSYEVGHELRRQLVGKTPPSAALLEVLMKNQHLIPDSWKKDGNGNTRYIFFWGTVYRNSGGRLCVRYLYWDGGRWGWSCRWLDRMWSSHYPALVPAS